MKKIKKYFLGFVSIVFIVFSLSSCAKNPGLYTWYGKRVNVDNIMKITLDMGEGEREISVPFSLYRTLFLYYKELIPETTVENGKERKTTDKEKSDAAKELTEDALLSYYVLMESGRDLGADVDSINSTDYIKKYKDSVIASADDEFLSSYDGGREAYAEKMLSDMLHEAGMDSEYFEYSCRRSDFEKALRSAVAPDAADYANSHYYSMKQLVFEYDFGNVESAENAREKANEALSLLESGTSMEDIAKKYDDASLNDVYIDLSGNIVGSSGEKSESLLRYVSALEEGGHSDVLDSGYSSSSSFFMIIERTSIDGDFICGAEKIASHMYTYTDAGTSSYTPHYLKYSAFIDAYTLNMSMIPADVKAYSLISVKSIY